MTHARSGLGIIAAEDKIYAIGGYGFGGWGIASYVSTNECYDPKTDKWTTLTSMPTQRSDFAIATYNGKIYCIGGGAPNTPGTSIALLNINEVYDIATDSWSTKAALPFSGKDLHANVVDGKIFVVGTRVPFKYGTPQDLYMYDPDKNVWTKKTSMPMAPPAGNFIVSSVVDDKIIFEGTFTIDHTYNIEQQKILIYDPKTDSWHEGTAGSTKVWCGGAGATTGLYAPKKFYSLGISSNNVYDHIKDSWSSAKAMPTERANFGVAVVEDVLYVIGGYTSDDFHLFGSTNVASALNEQYIPLGYNDAIPLTTSPSDASTPSNSFVSTEPSKSFLTGPIIAIITLTTGAIVAATATSLCIYLHRKKISKRNTHA